MERSFMPNHVINEVIFTGLTPDKIRDICSKCLNAKGNTDFELLLPIPLNVWRGSVGRRHEEAFQITALHWCRENWGTKWNAYSHSPVERGPHDLTLRFETAWGPPYGWLAAIFNYFEVSFMHNWLSEGGEVSHHDTFNWPEMGENFGDPWKESKLAIDDPLHRHLHKLLWGVEEFEKEGESA